MGGKHYTAEQKQYIFDNIDKSYIDIRKGFEERFNRKLSECQMDHFVDRYGIRHGHKCYPHQLEQFLKFAKNGQIARRKDIGYTRQQKNRLWVKTKNAPNHRNFQPLSHYVLEKQGIKIGKNEVVTFLDGNPKNVNIENLAVISLGEHGIMNIYHLRTKDREATKSGIIVAKLKMAIRDVEKKKKR